MTTTKTHAVAAAPSVAPQRWQHRLYLPRSWTNDPERLRAACVPEQTVFATRPRLAQQMITIALQTGTSARWVAADEVYGQNPSLRRALEEQRIGYVMAIPRTERVV